jgi:predicted Fe-Mo cluster-binding NifX family protein
MELVLIRHGESSANVAREQAEADGARAAQSFIDAGFTAVAAMQIGGDTQPEFLDWAEHELLPALRQQ